MYDEENIDFEDFIEIRNASASAVNLSGWYLSDDINTPFKWAFYAQTLSPNQHLAVLADEKNTNGVLFQHTNFKIENDTTVIYLSNSSSIVDSLQLFKLEVNQSIGKINGSQTGQVFFNVMTPNAPNTTPSFINIAGTPTINLAGGFFTTPISVMATCPIGQSAVYTTNAQTPTSSSPTFPPSLAINSTTVLKVRCKGTNEMLGNIKTETYFFNENTSLPVISISTDSANLWDWNTGIWVDGPNAAQWHGANYYKGWRRAAKVEYFENGIKQFGKDIAITNEGGSSIVYPKQSMRMIFNHSTLGNKKLSFTMFPNEKPLLNKFKNLRLRNGGNVYGIPSTNGGGGILYHDAIVQSLTNNLNVAHASYKPTIVYVNGYFWGLYEIREKIDDYFYASNYNADESDVRDSNGGWGVDYYIKWDTLISKIYNAPNKTTTAFYDSFAVKFDYKNVIDYYSSQIHFFNTDWVTPNYTSNVKMWVDTNAASDKRIRFTLHDLDYSFCNAYPNDNLMYVVLTTGALSPTVKIIRSLLQNPKFKKEFINRYADLVNYHFQEDSTYLKFDAAEAEVQNDVSRECNKWTTNTTAQWTNKFNLIRNCAATRNSASRNELDSLLLNKSGQINLTINTFPSVAGEVKISTLQPHNLPWTGIYFKGNEVPLEAVANSGYVFDHWETIPANLFTSDTAIIVDTFFIQNSQITAVFVQNTSSVEHAQNNLEYKLLISPNPVKDIARILLPKNKNELSIAVLDILGNVVFKEKINPSSDNFYNLNLEQLNSGVYLIQLKTKTNIIGKTKFTKY